MSMTYQFSPSGCLTVALIVLFALGLVALPLIPAAISLQSSIDNSQATAANSFGQTGTAIAAYNNAILTEVARTATARAWTPTPTPQK